jgi:hypothetical protein
MLFELDKNPDRRLMKSSYPPGPIWPKASMKAENGIGICPFSTRCSRSLINSAATPR